MAFVSTPLAGSWTGARLASSVAARPAVRPAGAASVTCQAPPAAFSSIRKPELLTLMSNELEDENAVVAAVYKQVFGNAYIMESELAELSVAESQFRLGELTTKGFVRELVKSEEYKKRFFYTTASYRFVELNIKHILGRGPTGQAEISYHVQKLISDGYDAEMDSYFDSFDYDDRFGEFDVPRFIFQGTYERNNDFNTMCVMRAHWDGCSTSTRTGSTAPRKPQRAQLYTSWGDKVGNSAAVSRGIPPKPEPASAVNIWNAPVNPNAPVRMRIKVCENLYQVFEVPAMMPKDLPSEEDTAWNKPAVKKFSGAFY